MDIANGISVVKRQKDELWEPAVLHCLPVTTEATPKKALLIGLPKYIIRYCCQKCLNPPLC